MEIVHYLDPKTLAWSRIFDPVLGEYADMEMQERIIPPKYTYGRSTAILLLRHAETNDHDVVLDVADSKLNTKHITKPR